jgi:perosamine synthetase
MVHPPIPVYTPTLAPSATRNVRAAVESGWISSEGEFIDQFEQAWAEKCNVRFGVATNSGTSALEIAMAALELPAGSEVILPSYTIISCASAILNAGCSIRLVDVDPETWCLNVDEVADNITSKTRAIMPVHMFGHPAEMGEIMKLAKTYDLKVIEDAAEAHGAVIDGEVVGGIGDIGCFSFYANKIITTGEGGMAVTDDEALAERLKSYRNLCFNSERRFQHHRMGHSYRMTNMQAAIGVSQVEHMDQTIAAKRKLAGQYRAKLKDVPEITLPVEKENVTNVYWMYGVVLNEGAPFEAEVLADRLRAMGIDTRPFFVGMHEQPVLKERGLFTGEKYPVTENLARRGLYLPSGTNLSADQIDQICDDVKKAIEP